MCISKWRTSTAIARSAVAMIRDCCLPPSEKSRGCAVDEEILPTEAYLNYGRQITEIESETGETKTGQERQRESEEAAGRSSQTESEKVMA